MLGCEARKVAKSENLKQESTQEDPFWEVVPATWEEKYEKDLN